jgi:K+-transporting ATPase ATPase A chain
LLLVSQGVVQNLRPYDTATLVEAQTIEVDRKDANGNVLTNPDGTNQKESKAVTQQTIAQEPVASQEFIKELGTNGSGFFNTNSAHPFENPTPFTNLIEMLAIFSIGAGLTYTLGRMTGSQKHGWAVLASMVLVFLGGVFVAYWAEARGNPILANLGTDP